MREAFAIRSRQLPSPGAGEVRVRNLWMSVDPFMHRLMRERPGFAMPFEVGQVLEGDAVGVVESSVDSWLEPGDLVLSEKGWREAFNAPASSLRLLDAAAFPPEAYLGVAGRSGLAAYVGVVRLLDLQPGETVFVSAAAGAVGAIACQIAKLRGATVVGSAGGPVKGAYLRRIGVDRVIDYKAGGDLASSLRAAAPEGLDACFDVVGGDLLRAAVAVARPHARFVLAGMVSALGDPDFATRPSPFPVMDVIAKRLALHSLVAADHLDLKPRFLADMARWIGEGRISWQQNVLHGIENAPEALLRLVAGDKFGKMLVRLADD